MQSGKGRGKVDGKRAVEKQRRRGWSRKEEGRQRMEKKKRNFYLRKEKTSMEGFR